LGRFWRHENVGLTRDQEGKELTEANDIDTLYFETGEAAMKVTGPQIYSMSNFLTH